VTINICIAAAFIFDIHRKGGGVIIKSPYQQYAFLFKNTTSWCSNNASDSRSGPLRGGPEGTSYPGPVTDKPELPLFVTASLVEKHSAYTQRRPFLEYGTHLFNQEKHRCKSSDDLLLFSKHLLS